MHGRRNRSVTAFTAALALAAPAAFVVALAPQQDAPTTLESATEYAYKTMVLETGANNRVFVDSNGNRAYDPAETKQDLTGSRSTCLLSTDGTLLSFTGSYTNTRGTYAPDVASLAEGSIGVAEKKTGTSCAQVGAETAEELTLGLGSLLTGSALPVQMKSASLDVELKQGARILATAYRGKDATGKRIPVAYFDLEADSSLGQLVTPEEGVPYVFNPVACRDAADNGPDSTFGDNCVWTIAAEGVRFDTLTLKAWTGDFSLEGGSDWTDPTAWPQSTVVRSTFELVQQADGILDCLQSVTLGSANGGTTPQVTVTRLKNATTDSCVRIPYAFSNGTQKAEFLKPLDVDASAQFVFDFVWTVPADTNWQDAEATSARLRTVVDFDSGGTLDGETEIPWCPDVQSTVIGSRTVGFVRDVATNPDAVDQAQGYPGTGTADTKQFACIVSQAPVLSDRPDATGDGPATEEDTLTIAEQVYVYGDVFLRKP